MDNIIVYGNGELEINVSIKEDTLWLTQKQIAELFAVTIPNISMHIKAIYKEDELDKNPTVKKYLTVQKEGNREVTRDLEHYSLDVIISVGYRVNSIKATKFRQWATSIGPYTYTLADTIFKSYVHEDYGIRKILGILNLSSTHSNFILNQASYIANKAGYHRLKQIRNTISNIQSGKLKVDEISEVSNTVTHENIRGAEYYKAVEKKEIN